LLGNYCTVVTVERVRLPDDHLKLDQRADCRAYLSMVSGGDGVTWLTGLISS
jgi:hypothetical protein